MLAQIGLFLASLVILYFGASWLVKGSSRLATALGIKAMVVGLTVVAFGTSSPESVVTIIAALEETQDLAFGNIVGSSIANIGLILGLSAIVAPLKVQAETLRHELPVAIAAAALLYVMAFDQVISLLEGLALLSAMALFLLYFIYTALKNPDRDIQKRYTDPVGHASSTTRNLFLLMLGLFALIAGAQMMVTAAVSLARATGVSELVIGLTVVAIGTSLPELATSVVASHRGQADLAVGNALGSNIFNIFLVIGLLALIRPVDVSAGMLALEFPALMFFSFLLIPLMRMGLVLNRIEGGFLFISYLVFVIFIFLARTGVA